MMFCNAGPIANSCQLGKEVVESAHAAFIKAVGDLATLGYDMFIDFKFMSLTIYGKDLKYKYNEQFTQ